MGTGSPRTYFSKKTWTICNYSPSDKIDQSKRTADIQGPGALQTGRKLSNRRGVTPVA